MSIGLRIPRGSMKPPMGAQVNPEHPFAKELACLLPINEIGCFGPTAPAFSVNPFDGFLLSGRMP
jgi:hypothetical protein